MYHGSKPRSASWVGVGALIYVLTFAVTAYGEDLRLLEAVKTRNVRAVQALLMEVDVNAASPDGATALLWAAQWDDVPTTDLLLLAGADVNTSNDYGVTPLFFAALNGSTAMTERLLRAQGNPNAVLLSGETLLMTAARTGKASVVSALLTAGANVNTRTTLMGQTALMWALSERHLPVARLLIEHGADLQARSASGFGPLLFAVRQGDLEAVEMLIAHGADLHETAANGTGVLHMAVIRGHLALAEFLLAQGVDPNADEAGYTPLHWAAGTWETATTRDYGVREWQTLVGQRGVDKVRLITALLAHGANPNARAKKSPPRFGSTAWKIHGGGSPTGATPLFFAAAAADLQVIQLLIANGADPLLATDDKTTPLLAAAGLGVEESETGVPESAHLEVVQFLTRVGADIRSPNTLGNTPLHAAAFLGYDSVARFLLERNVPLNTKNQAGQTPYKIASGIMVTMMFFQHSSTADLLRKAGGIE